MLALVIGNLVKGFRVIHGFANEEQAHSFVAENRRLVGSEYRLADCDHRDDIDLHPGESGQDMLQFGTSKPGEAVDPNTGLSTDTQERLNSDADRSTGGAYYSGASQAGAGLSGDDSPLPDLRGAGSASNRPDDDAQSDQSASGGGDGASGEGSVKDPLHPGEENG